MGGVPFQTRESPLTQFLRAAGIELPATSPTPAPSFDLGEFMQNVQTSGSKLADQSWRMFTHPDEVAKPLLDLVGGGMANLVPEAWRTPALEPQRQAAAALPGALASAAYESADVNKILQALYEDPIGALSYLEGPIAGGLGAGALGMAAVRKGPQVGADRVIREFAARMFETQGDAYKASRMIDLSDIPVAKRDDVMRRANEGFVKLVNSADPKMFSMDMQRRLVEDGIANKDWYTRSRRGMTHVMGDDPLMPPITSLASSQDSPYGNAGKALGVRAGIGAGMAPKKAIKEFGGLPNVKKGLRRLFGVEPGDAFKERKTSDFLSDLLGDYEKFVTDSWEGRGLGYAVKDNLTPALTSGKKVKTGLWLDWPRSSQANAGQVVRPLMQGFGIPGAAQIDLIEDVVGGTIGKEFGLLPAETQAAHWSGIQKYFGDKMKPYMKAPFDEQFLARLNEWGIKPRGPGEVFSPEEYAEMVAQIRRDKKFVGTSKARVYRGDAK